ncbi:MAG: NAD(P)-binding protein [Planctomycetota bacterium]
MSALDVILIGGGLRGLAEATRLRRMDGGPASILVVERNAWPGDNCRTQRTNGFSCEVGPFAFATDDLAPHFAQLTSQPRIVAAHEEARFGWLCDAAAAPLAPEARQKAKLEPVPHSFPTGCEELVQAYRRELDGALRLGRAVQSIEPRDTGDGFEVVLGGEVEARLQSRELVFATSAVDAGLLLGSWDPQLANAAQQATSEERAFVFLGGLQKHAPELHGFGLRTHNRDSGPEADPELVEAIFCSAVFPQRAMADRCLVRIECSPGNPDLPDDNALADLMLQRLRDLTGTQAAFPFVKVHRFRRWRADGAVAECRARLTELASRVDNLSLAP